MDYEEGEAIRAKLATYAKKNYVPKHGASDYLRYQNQHECDFEKIHPQDENYPYVWTMFSVPSQHVRGDCIEECLDQALAKAGWV